MYAFGILLENKNIDFSQSNASSYLAFFFFFLKKVLLCQPKKKSLHATVRLKSGMHENSFPMKA